MTLKQKHHRALLILSPTSLSQPHANNKNGRLCPCHPCPQGARRDERDVVAAELFGAGGGRSPHAISGEWWCNNHESTTRRTATTKPQLATGPQKWVVLGPVGEFTNCMSREAVAMLGGGSRRRREARRMGKAERAKIEGETHNVNCTRTPNRMNTHIYIRRF